LESLRKSFLLKDVYFCLVPFINWKYPAADEDLDSIVGLYEDSLYAYSIINFLTVGSFNSLNPSSFDTSSIILLKVSAPFVCESLAFVSVASFSF